MRIEIHLQRNFEQLGKVAWRLEDTIDGVADEI